MATWLKRSVMKSWSLWAWGIEALEVLALLYTLFWAIEANAQVNPVYQPLWARDLIEQLCTENQPSSQVADRMPTSTRRNGNSYRKQARALRMDLGSRGQSPLVGRGLKQWRSSALSSSPLTEMTLADSFKADPYYVPALLTLVRFRGP